MMISYTTPIDGRRRVREIIKYSQNRFSMSPKMLTESARKPINNNNNF